MFLDDVIGAPATAAAEIRTKKASSWTSELNENGFGLAISVCAVSLSVSAQNRERNSALKSSPSGHRRFFMVLTGAGVIGRSCVGFRPCKHIPPPVLGWQEKPTWGAQVR